MLSLHPPPLSRQSLSPGVPSFLLPTAHSDSSQGTYTPYIHENKPDLTNHAQLPPPSLTSYVPFLRSNDSAFGSRSGSGGLTGWFKKRNNRSAAGAYEPSGGGMGADDPWDSRVHDDYGYHEGQELETGYHGVGGSRGADAADDGAYEMNLPRDEEEGRGRTRPAGRNPFEDDAEASNMSVRGVSPRPMDAADPARGKERRSEDSNRRSMFREAI